MRSAELTLGRRFVVVLEPGEEVLSTLADWCAREGVAQGTLELFGAFRSLRLIAAHEPVADHEPPLAQSVEVAYLEGSGSGSISTRDGAPRVHLHLAAGAKAEGGAAYAGHVLAAEVHYTAEAVVTEVLSPRFAPAPDPHAHGLDTLRFA
jgi:predicted DNA-binding protein with PD1-like motif